MAHRDTLTGLDRYEDFLAKLDKEIAKIGERRIAIVYTDIKHFKYINDTYGYQRGDMLLKEFVHLTTTNNSFLLCAARVYSDNIVTASVLRNETSDNDFRELIHQTNLDLENKLQRKYLDAKLKLCTGIAVISNCDEDIDAATAVSNANLARKIAKALDQECCVLFKHTMLDSIKKEVEITSSLSEAIEDGELKVYYQPKVETDTLNVIGAEALIRWQKPDGRFIYPDEFIPLIERSGQIVELDNFVYREVFRFINQRIRENKPVVPISVNVSRVHMQKMEILPYIKSLYDEYKIPPEMVEFELTESIYIENTDKALKLVEGFHAMGARVSMDDFGSGYSSLNLLSRLPIDIIKLDRVFLKDEDAEEHLKENDKIIISCVIDMAKRLRITSLCEGVETLEQSNYLSEIGCEIQQGYYFSKPISQDEFETFLDKRLIKHDLVMS